MKQYDFDLNYRAHMFSVNWERMHAFLCKKLKALKKKISKNHKQIKKTKNSKHELCCKLRKLTGDEDTNFENDYLKQIGFTGRRYGY